LFLEGQTVQLLAGGQRASAFVFDMDLLFQQFVASLLQHYSRRILPEAWANSQIELQGSRSNRYLIQPPNITEGPMFHLKPDILLKFSGIPHLIIDTKNKTLPPFRPYRSVDEGDAYQMLAYASRFDCQDVLLLYPDTSGAPKTAPHCLRIKNSPIRIFVARMDLHQPLERLDHLIQEFRKILDFISRYEDELKEVPWHL
jgi:5-methylcytosine-specific restriction enzyme subunit McrC